MCTQKQHKLYLLLPFKFLKSSNHRWKIQKRECINPRTCILPQKTLTNIVVYIRLQLNSLIGSSYETITQTTFFKLSWHSLFERFCLKSLKYSKQNINILMETDHSDELVKHGSNIGNMSAYSYYRARDVLFFKWRRLVVLRPNPKIGSLRFMVSVCPYSRPKCWYRNVQGIWYTLKVTPITEAIVLL